MVMSRELPKVGETWRHYKGRECLVLGVLNNGDPKMPKYPIVALEISDISSDYNSETQVVESTKTKICRFYRSLDNFMASVECGYRFERVEDDESIWTGIVELDAALPI
jgi:hypothetical protein